MSPIAGSPVVSRRRPARSAVVGDRHHRGQRLGIRRRGPKRDGQAVAATDRDDLHPVDVAVQDGGVEVLRPQRTRELFGDDHRPMATAGAAERDAQVRLALAHERRHEQLEQRVEPSQELLRLRLAEDVVAHCLIAARERAKVVDPMRVREEAAVEHHVDVEREAVLVAERHHAHLQPGVERVAGEQLDDPGPQLVDVEIAGVDDDVGLLLQRLQHPAFALDAVGQAGSTEGMTAAAAFVAAHENVGVGVEEQDAHALRRLPQRLERGADLLLVVAAAHHQRGPLVGAAGVRDQLGELRDQRGRHVVDHEPPEVFEMVGGLRAPGARQPRDHNELTHAVFSATNSSRRGMVAASAYSSARARKPGGGAGSSMRTIVRPLAASALT